MYKLNDMRLSRFRFDLPKELIAQYPTAYREDARLMVVHRKSEQIEHTTMAHVTDYFNEGDMFVFNDTATFPARLHGKKEKTLADIEIFLLRELHEGNKFWDVLVDPARKIRIGNKLFFEEEPAIVAEVIDNTTSRGRTFRFLTDYTAEQLRQRFYEMGSTPIPKYIRRPLEGEELAKFQEEFPDMTPEEMDIERYQSIFAKHIGAVAAPATCLHFGKQSLKRMEIRGIEWGCITSHVNLGDFRPVDVEDLTKHRVESEEVIITREMADHVNHIREKGGKICAVGSEILRALETIAGTGGRIKEYSGWINKFIYPPYLFGAAEAFLCNLYFPLSPQHLMAVAFGGNDLTMEAYKQAIEQGYRFGDYGDAMLIID